MENGISFMLRAHNEEATLEQSIRSLLDGLTIPYEIVVILHLCTDRSEEIATRLAATAPAGAIRIVYYTHPISRAGYENLATDEKSCHSMAAYTGWCRSQCRSRWLFKWDADFVASPGLLSYLNGREWLATDGPENVRLSACNADMTNREVYLSSALVGYTKFYFWELPLFLRGAVYTDAPADARIEHVSLLADLKAYWRPERRPWYETEESEEAAQVQERLANLVRDFGSEPTGMARASNPACDSIFLAIKRSQPAYVRPTA